MSNFISHSKVNYCEQSNTGPCGVSPPSVKLLHELAQTHFNKVQQNMLTMNTLGRLIINCTVILLETPKHFHKLAVSVVTDLLSSPFYS